MRFKVSARDGTTAARRGVIETPHGTVETPVFMPVGTVGAVKTMTPDDLESLGVEIILGNTYHLMLRPGADLIEKAGGLHGFANWKRPILTDSGGFQVFSLADLSTLNDEGVTFRSHVDGREESLSPDRAIGIQRQLGSDISMVLDDCPPLPCKPERLADAMRRTLAWAKKSRDAFSVAHGLAVGGGGPPSPALFAIVQGGTDVALRRECAGALVSLGFDGYAIGGLSVGESKRDLYRIAGETAAVLPAESPRYLMGVGTPEDLWECVGLGVDMFDCVLPTRTARNGMLFTSRGRLNLKNMAYRDDLTPLDPGCLCYTCTRFSKAYLRHLFVVGEYLYGRLATLHNLFFYVSIMKRMRDAISAGRFTEERAAFLSLYRAEGKNDPELRTARPSSDIEETR